MLPGCSAVCPSVVWTMPAKSREGNIVAIQCLHNIFKNIRLPERKMEWKCGRMGLTRHRIPTPPGKSCGKSWQLKKLFLRSWKVLNFLSLKEWEPCRHWQELYPNVGVSFIRPLFTTTLGLPDLLCRMEKLTQATDLIWSDLIWFNANLHVDFSDSGSFSVMLFICLSVWYYSVVVIIFAPPPYE